jgi:hypothetical protein
LFVDGVSAAKESADYQAAYWRGYISRAEVQKVFDEFGTTVNQQAQGIVSLNILCGYIMESLGKTPDDFRKWLQEHAEKAALGAAASDAGAGAAKEAEDGQSPLVAP